MVSRKEYILCTVQSSTFPSSSRITKLCSVKATSDPHSISISLLRPVETFNNNTLLIHFDSTPEHFSVISHNWLELQHVIQELYLEHSSSNDFQCEALVQKLTRVWYIWKLFTRFLYKMEYLYLDITMFIGKLPKMTFTGNTVLSI